MPVVSTVLTGDEKQSRYEHHLIGDKMNPKKHRVSHKRALREQRGRVRRAGPLPVPRTWRAAGDGAGAGKVALHVVRPHVAGHKLQAPLIGAVVRQRVVAAACAVDKRVVELGERGEV